MQGSPYNSLLLIVLLVLLTSCVAPDTMLRTADQQQKTISRGLADAIDAADRAFGEPRVEDRERIVQVKVGLQPSYWKEDEFTFKLPIRTRLPIPAIERRFNLFFEFGSESDENDTLDETLSNLDRNKNVAATLLTQISKQIDAGIKLDVFWSDGPQTGIRPFARWDRRTGGLRYFIEQQVYYNTDDHFGGSTVTNIDQILDDRAVLRYQLTASYSEIQNGVILGPSVIYRRPVFKNAMISGEIGSKYNPHQGASEGNSIADEDDSDHGLGRIRLTGITNIAWLEYDIETGVDYFWLHRDEWDYGVSFTMRIVFESYLRSYNRQ